MPDHRMAAARRVGLPGELAPLELAGRDRFHEEAGSLTMTPRQIDRFCASLPAATRIVQWEGVAVFKVGGKMFCLIAPDDHSVGRISFKSAPEHYEALSRSPGFRPAPYLARAKWVAVDDPAVLSDREMKAYIRRAHAVIAAALPNRTRQALGL
jgi:predicted DNA-binding protein (MmcQ/YjbR family)